MHLVHTGRRLCPPVFIEAAETSKYVGNDGCSKNNGVELKRCMPVPPADFCRKTLLFRRSEENPFMRFF